MTVSQPVDRAGRRRPLQMVLGIVLFVLAQTLAVAGGGLLAVLAGDDLSGGTPGWARLVGALLGAGLAIGGLLVIVGPIGGRPGLMLRGTGAVRELVLGLLLGAGLIGVSTGLILLLGGLRFEGVESSPELLVPLALGIGAAFSEEVFFRGVLLRLFEDWWGSRVALAITALVFGLAHFTNDGATLASAVGLVIEAGILLGAAYLVTRRLWFVIGIHLAWNAVQGGVFSSSISGTGAQHGLLRLEATGPDWLTGGAMGVEGSVVTVLVGLVAGIVLLVVAARRGHLVPSAARERSA